MTDSQTEGARKISLKTGRKSRQVKKCSFALGRVQVQRNDRCYGPLADLSRSNRAFHRAGIVAEIARIQSPLQHTT
jgi:hypothetical protein